MITPDPAAQASPSGIQPVAHWQTNDAIGTPVAADGTIASAATAPRMVPLTPTMVPSQMSPGGVVSPVTPGIPSGLPTPAYAPQPVQLGAPAPLSQNPAAAWPAISAVVPVVPAF
jgi:hypothetical protein